MSQKKYAFSLIELSIVVLIIGILIAGVTQGSRLVNQSRLTTVRSLTRNSPVASISGLQLWFEPTLETSFKNASNAYEIEDGDKISNWLNSNAVAPSFIVTQPTPALQPTYILHGINNLPTLFFDANNAGSSGNAFTMNYDNAFNSPNFTIFVVTEPLEATTTWGTIIMSRDANASDRKGYNIYKNDISTQWQLWTGNLSTWYQITTAISFDQPLILTALRDNVSSKLYTNNILQSSVVSPFNNNKSINFYIGSATFGAYYDGYISEIIYYDRALKSEERQSVNDYLAKKYNIN